MRWDLEETVWEGPETSPRFLSQVPWPSRGYPRRTEPVRCRGEDLLSLGKLAA